MGFNMKFFNNKRLLVILSGIACILIALVIFVVSLIGFGNIGAFLGGKPSVTEAPAGDATPNNVATATPTVSPTQTSDAFYTPGIVVTTPPAEETTPPDMTTPPATETPTGPATEEPTPTDIPVSSITIAQGMTYTLTVGETVQLNAIVLPVNATEQTVTWTNSSGTNVAMVNANGMVAALSVGEAKIKASAGGAFAQITITVKAATVAVDRVIFDDDSKTLQVGESTTLTYTVSPSNATETKATWKSSDDKVVAVINGKITAVGAGTATVTVTVGGQKDTVEITVTAPATPTPEDPTPTPEKPTPEDPTTTPDAPADPSAEATEQTEA